MYDVGYILMYDIMCKIYDNQSIKNTSHIIPHISYLIYPTSFQRFLFKFKTNAGGIGDGIEQRNGVGFGLGFEQQQAAF